ncbi:type A von Willebrand factor domain-containing protein, partial [Reticulomyxa filosa]
KKKKPKKKKKNFCLYLKKRASATVESTIANCSIAKYSTIGTNASTIEQTSLANHVFLSEPYGLTGTSTQDVSVSEEVPLAPWRASVQPSLHPTPFFPQSIWMGAGMGMGMGMVGGGGGGGNANEHRSGNINASNPFSSSTLSSSDTLGSVKRSQAISQSSVNDGRHQDYRKNNVTKAISIMDKNNKTHESRKVVRKQKINTNVVALDLGTLGNKANAIATGDAYTCNNTKCKAILSAIDKLATTDEHDQTWHCQLCGQVNTVDIEQDEVPQGESVDYILEPPSDEKSTDDYNVMLLAFYIIYYLLFINCCCFKSLKNNKNKNHLFVLSTLTDFVLINRFCVDISGSMVCTFHFHFLFFSFLCFAPCSTLIHISIHNLNHAFG